MSNYPAEQQPIPFTLSDYSDRGIDFDRPEVNAAIYGSLGDMVLFENLVAIRLIWDITERHSEKHDNPSGAATHELRNHFDAILERRQQLGDIPRKTR